MLRGCVPKKLMVFGGEYAEAFRDSKGFGYALTLFATPAISCCFLCSASHVAAGYA